MGAGDGRSSLALPPAPGTRPGAGQRGELFHALLDHHSQLPIPPLGSSSGPKSAETFPYGRPRASAPA
jgi:hypothetical protein